MYEELNCFEEALKHFGTRVEIITAMEMARKLSAEEAYQMIKDELKEVKKCRKRVQEKWSRNIVGLIIVCYNNQKERKICRCQI